MTLDGRKGRNLLKQGPSFLVGIGRLPLLICILFFFATSAWILFEHAFLPWSPRSKDFFWAFLSTGVLYLLLDYGVSVVRKSDAAQKDSEEHLSRLLENSASGILVMDKMGVVTYANLETASLLGGLRSDIVGRNLREWPWEISSADGSPLSDEDLPFSRVAMTGQALYGFEMGVRRTDGSRVILSVNIAPLVDDGGNVSEMIASFFDVTARRDAESLHLR